MPVLIPFDECIARPDDGDRRFLLRDHLLGVSHYMEERVRQHPATSRNRCLIRLAGLAGLCHDLAKCDAEWQHYIRNLHDVQQGPPHAPAGAFLFSYFGFRLLKVSGEWNRGKRLWFRLIRDIADHHGTLKAVGDENWQNRAHWERMDLAGMRRFVSDCYEELETVPLTAGDLEDWFEELPDFLEELEKETAIQCREIGHHAAMKELHEWRDLTAALIAGDRFDIRPVSPSWLDGDTWKQCERELEAFCSATRHHALAGAREEAQRVVMEQLMQKLKENPDTRIISLDMPTGYGKTITSLKIAAWLGERFGLRKIVYVAPYLSILEQTSGVIREAMRLQVLEHHSLAIWDETEAGTRKAEASGTGRSGKGLSTVTENRDQRVPGNQLVVESWAHEVICTSFQQFSRAVFPRKAQDTLRKAFLHDCAVIIDEPQIFRPEGWNTFLCGLETLAEQHNLRVLFLSATMPPFDYGLSRPPVALSYTSKERRDRYIVTQAPTADERGVAEALLSRPEATRCAILNTIGDAYLAYRELTERNRSTEAMLVHGLMTPLHKKVAIEKIRHHLARHRDVPLVVVATQVLEAGVDVSFRLLYRALPILPSIVQAAGRVNRHLEQENRPGELVVFPFLRNGEKNTRGAIYDKPLCDITDRLLGERELWTESEMNELVARYYREMFRQNTHETGKKKHSRSVSRQLAGASEV